MHYGTLISVDELAQQIEHPDWVVIDCRFALNDTGKGRFDYGRSHIPGAIYAHLDEDLSGPILPGTTGRHPLPDVNELVRTFSRWGIDASMQVVAYDDMGGPFAARLWWLLKWMGHDAVAVLDGGWPAWLQQNLPTNAEIPNPQPGTFSPNVRQQMVATAKDVERIIENQSALLVDARTAERHAGIHEPLDPVAGHIPGAICYPWMENLDDTKHFLSPAQLRRRFATHGETPEPKVNYCGSGVTGAHNVLAMTHAGLKNIRLYAGSWSEWITNPTHAVATMQK